MLWKRLLVSYAMLVSCGPAFATLSQPSSVSRDVHRPPAAPVIHITDDTEVMLDGELLGHREIPDGAEIILLEVRDGKVTRLHFRSAK